METMETSFYPEDSFIIKEKMRNLKHSMTLDLESGAGSKRQKFSLLSTPDLTRCKLGTPDLEKLLNQQDGQITTTPTPTQFIFPKNVTEEQEMYARGFVDALAELRSNHCISPPLERGGNCETHGMTYTTFPPAIAQNTAMAQMLMPPYSTSSSAVPTSSCGPVYLPVEVTIKEEPQTVPNLCSSPPLSPIDMLAQEKIKLERKRQRNRVAASKCRRRKLERIAKLEDKVKLLKNENQELGTVVTKLKDHICGLKQQLMEHVNSGCQILTPAQYLN